MPENLPDPRPRVLIVDDERMLIDILVEAIRPSCRIMVAQNGEQALKAARGGPRPDLILLDVLMPGLDGYEVCRLLKEEDSTRDIPVIFITSKTEVADETRGFELGAVDYISKPISPPIVRARVKTHLALKRSLEVQQEQNRALQELNQVKNRFLGMAAHDLRNPLVSIRGMSELLQSVALPEEKRRGFLHTIQQVANQMLTLVNDLLDVAAIESGHFDMVPQEHNLSRLAAERAELIGFAAREKGISLMVEMGQVPDSRFDPDRMAQVLDNLLSNAVKFSRPGTRVLLRTLALAEHLAVEVDDQGPGLSADDLGRLFGTFQRLSARPTGNERSTGLGLSICKKIVEAHGGAIRVDSEVGRGSRFTVSLPRHPPEP
ncbi:MAG: hybrid sensor histidine kinase/response regulator [Magnetococcales bacterium]|nr:hybrid sensor histidine kinase/response regulator [Magnetococcales bacterium]